MMKTEIKMEFDPGFARYILAFQGTVQYLYMDINKFKNLSQRKVKFMQYYKKILDMFYNNVGFYTGCLMWAVYLKAQDEGEIHSNRCYGTEYDEKENIADTQYMLKFIELFPKDMKYYLGKDFSFEPETVNLIKVYEEFLVLNKGFTKTKLNSDLVLPSGVKTNQVNECKAFIDKALESGNLAELKANISCIL